VIGKFEAILFQLFSIWQVDGFPRPASLSTAKIVYIILISLILMQIVAYGLILYNLISINVITDYQPQVCCV
jgi:hypothetical protein